MDFPKSHYIGQGCYKHENGDIHDVFAGIIRHPDGSESEASLISLEDLQQ